MLTNFIKITLRNLIKNKTHAAINLFGLAIGLACTTLIALWIQRELSVNDFHVNKGQLFRVLENQTYAGNEIFTFAATPGPLAQKLKDDFPEITHASRVTWGGQNLITVGGLSFYEAGLSVDPDFMEMFSFPLVLGNIETALAEPNNILISEELANKYYGSANLAMDKMLQIDAGDDYKVVGILKNVPVNSSFDFDFLLPLDNHLKRNGWLENWGSNGIRTYLMAQPGATVASISDKIKNVVKDNNEGSVVDLHVQAMADWYLRTDFENGTYAGGGRIEQVRMFGIIAIFILLIACINFMNLSTAKSASRALEVGVRKVTGATRGMLALQFLGESALMSLIAGLLGVALASMFLPYFNQLFELELSLNMAGTTFWVGLASIVSLTGLVAGSYPALFLSGFEPVKVLKGLAITGGRAANLRRALVTVQFFISVFLIISTIVIYQQMDLIRHQRLGYEKENLVFLPINGTLFEKYETVKTELSQLANVMGVSHTTGWIHAWGNNTSDYDWPGKDPEEDILIQTVPVGYDFVATIGAKISEGRDFSPEFPADSSNFVINETAARLMGLDAPVGQQMSLHGEPGTIVGVVSDFHVGSFREKQDPLVMTLRDFKNWMYVRISPSDYQATLSGIETVLKKHNPAYPFEYHFTDQEYEQLHRSEQRTGELAKVFAFLAIFVSCLGLFGLASFSTEQRKKEVGIRKVLGASVTNLTGLLSKDFLVLVILAIVLATPLAWWAMNGWLQDFEFRVDLQWWMFALSGILALLIAFLTVSFQSIKAALANPVDSLRSD
ncbi:MAG: ABC transporter permease [Bacteroidota bacterium]